MMPREEYNKIFENGLKHIESAKVLAKIEMFGSATSHLILGIEELIKYQVIMTKSVNNYPFDDVISPPKGKSIFTNHTTKHNLIKEFQESISDNFANNFFESLLLRSNEIGTEIDTPPILNNRFKEWGLFFNIAGSEMNIPVDKRAQFFTWLKEANNTKNNGFYANWKNDKIETPDNNFAIKDYETALTYASSILKQTEFMKSVDMTEEEIIEWQKINRKRNQVVIFKTKMKSYG